jgi:hypothetical protein
MMNEQSNQRFFISLTVIAVIAVLLIGAHFYIRFVELKTPLYINYKCPNGNTVSAFNVGKVMIDYSSSELVGEIKINKMIEAKFRLGGKALQEATNDAQVLDGNLKIIAAKQLPSLCENDYSQFEKLSEYINADHKKIKAQSKKISELIKNHQSTTTDEYINNVEQYKNLLGDMRSKYSVK